MNSDTNSIDMNSMSIDMDIGKKMNMLEIRKNLFFVIVFFLVFLFVPILLSEKRATK